MPEAEALGAIEDVPGVVEARPRIFGAVPTADGAPVTDARASLRRAGKLLESVRIREGLADFADLEPAETYEMEIKREGSTLGELCLSFLAV